jgi:Prokaryotic N-terminal methylation motif
MLCQRPSMTIRQCGFTLIEVAIASTLFLMMSIVLFSLFQQTQKATGVAIESTDITSKMLLVFEKIQNETKGVRILGPTTDDKLEYWKVRTVDGIPQLTPLGRPDYLPGSPQVPDSAFLYLSGGKLMSDFQGTSRLLTRVGDGSILKYGWSASTHTLTLAGRIESDGKAQGENFVYKLYVSNNE